ncbi:MAG: YggS family pyridoxal phosphate-dependent enzyme [Gammaproteobacteria bacterium]|nr:YggS family pyridoxal phosphate-dependent enzyme [Gammaproteobacteria bacterium]
MESEAICEVALSERLMQLRETIADLAVKYHRQPDEIRLLAVSKKHSVNNIRTAYHHGQTAFGENYVDEAEAKIKILQDLKIDWHYIGPIQSNKTRRIAEQFMWVHSIDRVKVAQRLNDQRPGHLPPLNVCIQVNIDLESTKSGALPEHALALVEAILLMPKLRLRGLMAVPRPRTVLNEQREPFARLRQLFERLKSVEPKLDTLSMGMSADIEAAIAEGTTMLRVGTALFGPRV